MTSFLDLVNYGRRNDCSDIHLSRELPPVFRKNGKLYQSDFEHNPQIIENLSKRFGSDPFIHEFNGIGFHHLHSSGIDGFCTPDRVQEIRSLMPQFEAGEFPVIF